MIEIIRYNLLIALEAIVQNRLRAFLTSLGIIFGVASVIAMLAIGKGAEQQILEQMKLLGTNNIIIQPVVEQEEGRAEDDDNKPQNKRYTPGLTLDDLTQLENVIPTIKMSTPEIIGDVLFVRNGIKKTGKMIGVDTDYFSISATELESGTLFSEVNSEQSMPVCVIGKNVKTKFFAGTNPIAK